MAIEQHGAFDWFVDCDKCSNYLLLDHEDFYDVIEEMKDKGWRARRIDGEWQHYCPSCRGGEG